MDKYLKMFEPAMKKWLSEHYPPDEAKTRWERTVALDENEYMMKKNSEYVAGIEKVIQAVV